MNEEQNKLIVTRFINELWNERKLELADELIALHCVTHQLRSGEPQARRVRHSQCAGRQLHGL